MSELFQSWVGQKTYNAEADVEDKLFTKTQMYKFFH